MLEGDWIAAMSALGHKRTYAVQQPMSALPPIATAKADIRKTAPKFRASQVIANTVAADKFSRLLPERVYARRTS
jgi:hypothetical protein